MSSDADVAAGSESVAGSGRVAAGSVAIEVVGTDQAAREIAGLVRLLKDAVDSGASVGYLPPLAEAEGEAYWRGVVDEVRRGSCVLLGARDADGALVGTAQLLLAMRPNGSHRAEVAKVIVHTEARRRGIGRALMLGSRSARGGSGVPPWCSTRGAAIRPSGSTLPSATPWPA